MFYRLFKRPVVLLITEVPLLLDVKVSIDGPTSPNAAPSLVTPPRADTKDPSVSVTLLLHPELPTPTSRLRNEETTLSTPVPVPPTRLLPRRNIEPHPLRVLVVPPVALRLLVILTPWQDTLPV